MEITGLCKMFNAVFRMFVFGIVIPHWLNGQRVMEFCSGRSFRRSVSSRSDERLVLDASDSAIVSRQFMQTIPTGVTSCVCKVRYAGQEDSEVSDQQTSDVRGGNSTSNKRLSQLFIRHRVDGTRNCGKSIEVSRFGLLVSFRCTSRDLQLQNIPVGGNVTLILEVEAPKPSDTLYEVEFEPDGVTAIFYVTCWPPSFPSSTPYTTPYDSTTMTTLSDSGESGQDNTGVVVGVVVGIAVTSVIIIVGVICMRRRNIQKNDKSKEHRNMDRIQKKDGSRESPYNTLESETESHIYDYIRPEDVRREPSLSRNTTANTNSRTFSTNSAYGDTNRTDTKAYYISDNNPTRIVGEMSKDIATSKNQNQLHYSGGYVVPIKPIPEYLDILPS